MSYYTYDNYLYIHNKNDATEEHHSQSILKKKSDIYITSLSNLMDESLKYLPTLFVDKMIMNVCLNMSKFFLSCQM